MATEKRGRRGGVMLPRLHEIRLERGYTVRGLAEAAGVNPATVTAAENGHRGVQGSTLRALASTLGVDAAELVGSTPLASVSYAREDERERRRHAVSSSDPAELVMAFAARDRAKKEGRDPFLVYEEMRGREITVEDVLGGALVGLGADDSLERARNAAANYAGLDESDRGPRLPDGEGCAEEISAQRAGRLRG